MPSTAVHLRQRSLDDYAQSTDRAMLAELSQLSASLAGLRVLHLSASPFGSAVAELLAGLIPLQRDLGLLADWQVLRSDIPQVWAALYDGLSGKGATWGRRARTDWYGYAHRHAGLVRPGYDIVVAHDPQALAIAYAAGDMGIKWVWHCHLDMRMAQPEIWADILTVAQAYSAALFPAPDLVCTDLPIPFLDVARPAIDPCSARNAEISSRHVRLILESIGIDPDRPLIGQFSPIDHRYAPIAALGTYWIARQKIPGLQIVLADLSPVPSLSKRRALADVGDSLADDDDIRVLTSADGLSPIEYNALQRACSVVLQAAVPTGFGWGVAESQWKAKPVIVGQYGLLPEQSRSSGFVVEGAADGAERLVELLGKPTLAHDLGFVGRERVRRNHLITGLALDYARLFQALGAGQSRSEGRDSCASNQGALASRCES